MSFAAFQPGDSVISSDATISAMWSNGITTLTSFFTSSNQEVSNGGRFYLDVYNSNPLFSSAAEVQFSIAYGHVSGSGSAYFNNAIPDKTPTRDIYGQYRNLIFGDENAAFTFGSSTTVSPDIIVLSINRARFKEAINPGSLTLKLTSGSNSITLTDDSTVTTTSTFIGSTQVYQLLSGSANNVYSTSYTSQGSYGIVLPNEGLIVLNPRALALAPGTNGGISAIFNNSNSATSLSTGNANNSQVSRLLNSFNLQNYETISSAYFFVRVKNSDFNYTTNPSIIDSNGNLLYTSLIYNPQTYATTIGLFNNSGDLLAVAKLNKPLVKDFTKEMLLRVKLDF